MPAKSPHQEAQPLRVPGTGHNGGPPLEPTAPLFLTIPEACRELRLSRTAVYGLISSKRLGVVRFNTSVRIPRAAIEALATTAQ